MNQQSAAAVKLCVENGDDVLSIAPSETPQFDHRKEIKYGKPIRVFYLHNKDNNQSH